MKCMFFSFLKTRLHGLHFLVFVKAFLLVILCVCVYVCAFCSIHVELEGFSSLFPECRCQGSN